MAQVGQRDTSLDARGGVASKIIPLGARIHERLPDWLSHWELWLALLLGGWLRLFALNRTLWLDDQTQLLDMARTAILRGMIPVTGIPSSVGFLNSSISIYLLLPIAAFTSNPLPQTIALALWNVVGVAICYVAALHGFGRRVAAWSALFFAVCPASVWYSRFLWQQNSSRHCLASALTLFAAVKTSGRRWFVAHVLLLLACILLHPTVAYLIPVTLIAFWLSPHRPRCEYALAAAGVLLLLAPTLLGNCRVVGLTFSCWRVQRREVRVMTARWLSRSSTCLARQRHRRWALARPQPAHAFFNVLTALTVALLVVGWVRLTWRLWRGLRGVWRPAPLRTATWRDRVAWLGAITSGIRSDETWRLSFVLWLWVTIPPVAMIRHSITIFAHYLLVLYPGIFIVIGLGAASIVSWARNALRSVQINQQRRAGHARANRPPRRAHRALDRAARWPHAPVHTAHNQRHTAAILRHRGLRLSAEHHARRGGRAQRATTKRGSPMSTSLTSSGRHPAGLLNDLATLLRDERSTRSMMDSACLRLPGTGESLIVAEKATVPAAQLLASLPTRPRLARFPCAKASQ
jgi:hypothetical protein